MTLPSYKKTPGGHPEAEERSFPTTKDEQVNARIRAFNQSELFKFI